MNGIIEEKDVTNVESLIQNLIEKNQPEEITDFIKNHMTNKELIELRLGANSKTSILKNI